MGKYGKAVGAPYTPGSEPSEDTAKIIAGHVPNQRERAWTFIRDAGDYGAIHDEIVAAGINAETGGSRLTELRDLGRVKETNRTRQTRADCPARVHVAIDPEDWKDKRDGWPSPEKSRSKRSRKSRLRFAAKTFEEIIDRTETSGLFAVTEIQELAERALAVVDRGAG